MCREAGRHFDEPIPRLGQAKFERERPFKPPLTGTMGLRYNRGRYYIMLSRDMSGFPPTPYQGYINFDLS